MRIKLPKVSTRKRKASWIWSDAQGHKQNVYYYFRKTFDLSERMQDLILFITAVTRYQLFINGSFVGRGPSQSQPFYQVLR